MMYSETLFYNYNLQIDKLSLKVPQKPAIRKVNRKVIYNEVQFTLLYIALTKDTESVARRRAERAGGSATSRSHTSRVVWLGKTRQT